MRVFVSYLQVKREMMVTESMRMCMLKTGSVSPEGAFKDKQESNDDNISASFGVMAIQHTGTRTLDTDTSMFKSLKS